MKELTDTIKVFIKGEDFIGTNYLDNEDCALARALKREGYEQVDVGGCDALIKDVEYEIADYGAAVLSGYRGEYPNGVEVILTRI